MLPIFSTRYRYLYIISSGSEVAPDLSSVIHWLLMKVTKTLFFFGRGGGGALRIILSTLCAHLFASNFKAAIKKKAKLASLGRVVSSFRLLQLSQNKREQTKPKYCI